jgi:hypothetical protein
MVTMLVRKACMSSLSSNQCSCQGVCRMDLPGPTTSVGTRTDY